jgi:hypothetical protein
MPKKIFASLVLGLLILPLTAAPGVAKDGDVRKSGSCSDGSIWKLKAGKRDGGLEVEAEVDSNVVGQSWRWNLKRDGNRFASGHSTTRGPSGSFSVERRTANGAGKETISLRATHNGEVCGGSLTI